MVIDTDVIAQKLALPKLRPYVNIAKFGGCCVGLRIGFDLANGHALYTGIFVVAAIIGFMCWRSAAFLRSL